MLTSVWESNDGRLLTEMAQFYTGKSLLGLQILDSTYNTGKMWKGTGARPFSMDIDPTHNPDRCCDNRQMPGVADSIFDLVVYDPPHCGANGRDKSSKDFDGMYGCNQKALKAEGYTLSFLYPGFLAQARRVLKPGGLVFAKITDQVNSHRSRWAHVDFMTMAADAGFTVCDLIIKVRTGPMMSNKWKTMHHARKRHSFWIILRNGPSCE